jgi:UDP-N-acetylmuramoylalanine--D-glutamate ligase
MNLSGFDWVILSPGVSPHQPCFENYKNQQGRLIGDIELFALFNQTPLIGITGSNGKTTVTDMLGVSLRAAGLRIELAGNYGKCALDLLLDYPDEHGESLDFIVLELSSFQLEMCQHLRLEVATILNITEDHIDRHGNFENYKAA